MKHSPKNLEPNLEWFEFETATVSLEQAELCIRLDREFSMMAIQLF